METFKTLNGYEVEDEKARKYATATVEILETYRVSNTAITLDKVGSTVSLTLPALQNLPYNENVKIGTIPEGFIPLNKLTFRPLNANGNLGLTYVDITIYSNGDIYANNRANLPDIALSTQSTFAYASNV